MSKSTPNTKTNHSTKLPQGNGWYYVGTFRAGQQLAEITKVLKSTQHKIYEVFGGEDRRQVFCRELTPKEKLG